MSVQKFTPGPWEYGFNAREFEHAVYAGNVQIAAVWGETSDEAKASALLMAAAQALYEALRDARAIVACAAPEHDLALERIDAAITKAEGRLS